MSFAVILNITHSKFQILQIFKKYTVNNLVNNMNNSVGGQNVFCSDPRAVGHHHLHHIDDDNFDCLKHDDNDDDDDTVQLAITTYSILMMMMIRLVLLIISIIL